jgi:hypothetical protein
MNLAGCARNHIPQRLIPAVLIRLSACGRAVAATRAAGGIANGSPEAAQQMHADGHKDSHATKAAHNKAPILLGPAQLCEKLQTGAMGDEGLEPPTSTV